MHTAYIVAPIVGLLSAVHCVGMCGGIVGALSLSLPRQVRRRGGGLAAYVIAYNAGRISSYAAAGALFGGLGGLVGTSADATLLAQSLRALAAVVTVVIGLHLLGWLPRLALLERIGEPVWRRLAPLGRRLLPVRTPTRAFLFGAVWGWLPCGLVYAMLLGAPAQGSALGGAVYMSLFGLGTLLPVAATGLAAGRVWAMDAGRGTGAWQRLRMSAGALVLLLGVFPLVVRRI